MKLLRYLFPILSTLASLASITTATAQITPDSSLGAESSIVNPDVINGIQNDRISGGATRGSSLFHSFQEFNVGEGRGAYFSNPANITNILTRVTGGNPSNILGKLGVLGNANLFLLNPKGIFFGPNASLDLNGSFFGTTADSFIFNDNFEFSATNPQAVPLLSVNIPIGLRFRDNPGSITNQSIFRNANSNLVGLQVQPGNSLALVGGNINLSDGGRLTASGGSIELGGLATAGTVGLDITGNSYKLNFPSNSLLSDITISNARVQNVVFPDTTGNAGDVKITTRNLSLTDGGQVSASTYGRGNAGSVIINASGNISVAGVGEDGFLSSGIFSEVSSNAEGNGGDIQINTKDLSLTNGGQINASTFGKGNAGSVIINATGNIFADGVSAYLNNSGIFNEVSSNAVGNGGDIQINTKDLSLTNGGQISASTFGNGNAGSVIINASGNISVAGGSGIFSIVGFSALGDADGIEINTSNISLRDGAFLYSVIYGQGNAGNITINALNTINFDGTDNQGFPSGVFSIVGAGGRGNGGDVNITSGGSLSLTNGSQINSFIRGAGIGDAGNVRLNIRDTIQISGKSNIPTTSGNFNSSAINSSVGNGAFGNTGNIEITTGSLFITDRGELSTSSLGNGNAGSILIRAADTVALTGAGSNVFSTLGSGSAPIISIKPDDKGRPRITRVLDQQTKFPNARGNTGNINISTSSLSVTDGARLSTSTSGQGNAGNINIFTVKKAIFSGTDANNSPSGAFSAVESGAVGKGGTININTNELTVDKGAQLVANTSGRGNAGFVRIDATDKVVLDGIGSDRSPSGIFTAVDSSGQGDGGTIYINSGSIFVNNGAQLSADARGQGNAGNQSVTGRGGDIKITTNDFVLLRRNSLISATSERQNGIDGNITINTPFLIAFPSENSDIVATGSGRSAGSNVRINALGIFGIKYQPQRTPQSDIVATGSVGLFTLNTQEVGQVLPELPQNPTDPSNQIAQNPCQKGSGSSFVFIGRGGLPSSPNDGFSNNETRVDLVEPVASSSNSQAATTNQSLTDNNAKPIIPAQGWIFNSKGEVVLTAYDPTTTSTPQRSSKPTAACPAF